MPTSRALAACLALALAACARNHAAPDSDGGLAIGGIPFRVASGTTRPDGAALGLYLTDQPDACLAITRVPVGAAVIFSLRVAPQADGTREALVVRGPLAPGPGEAVGGIRAQTSGVETAGYAALDGTVAWTANANGTTTIDALDVGFDGPPERLQATALTLPPCP
jgi:hypothetical protein